jgi:hypothetical protein
MKLNPLLLAAALLYVVPGLALTFAPQETLGALGFPPSLLGDWLAQLLGAALLGLALLSWVQRHTLIGGVFGRPLLMTNLLFTTASFFASFRTWRQVDTPPLLVATILLGALAAAFGARLLRPLKPPET